MTRYCLYVVDDEKLAREGLSLALQKTYQVLSFATAESALEAISHNPPDLVLLDVGLPGMSGVEALKEIRTHHPDVLTIMITAYEDVKTVVAAMKHGAYDYIVKPVQMEALMIILRNALESISMRKEIQSLHEKYLKENLPCFIGDSNAVQGIMDLVDKVAKSPDTPVLIHGETGTGKELIARAIHYKSPNFKGSLVAVNCAAIPKELIESELFGYEKGAFSGADKAGKAGLVEQAADGTLFLDEVGDLSPEAQAKLLRFLDEGKYYRVGGTRSQTVKTRIISATNRDLQQLVDDGKFRLDLYHRFAVVKLEIPSLNQRRDDILPLARHFLVAFSQKFNKSFSAISSGAEKLLKERNWDGNVRELKNLMERAVLLADGPVLTVADLGLEMADLSKISQTSTSAMQLPDVTPAGIDFPAIMAAIEKRYLDSALALSRDNESQAARLLNLSRDQLRYRRQKLAVQ